MDRIFSINDLLEFCRTKKCYSFSTKNPNERIKIREVGMFSAEGEDDTLSVKLQSCHVGRNLNHSFISKDSMTAAMPSFKGKPILGAFVQNEDTKEWDFNGHDVEFYEDENGEIQTRYIEQIIGNVSEIEDPYLEYDETQDKDYVIVKGKIFKEYTKAEEIIQRRKSCACSVELAVDDLSYNVKEDCIELNSFVFSGVTLLGENVKPGMAGSNLVIDTFEEKGINYQNKMIEVLEKLNTTLSNFNNSEQKGGEKIMNKFEELLAKYNVTAEDVDFETEELSDEELEVKFAEVFGDSNEEDPIDEVESAATDDGEEGTEGEAGTGDGESEEGATSEDGDEPVATETEACGGKKKHKKCSIDENGDTTISFEISHEDIRGALFQLLAVYEEEDNEWYWVTNVYDDYFIFENWSGDKLYKQSYSVDGDNVSLDGDRQIMFKMILTESEKLAIDKMREDYAALETKYNELKTFKDEYDAKELKSKKDAIFARAEYSVLSDNEAFKALIADSEKYSVDECENKADVIFAKYCKTHGEFAVQDEKRSHTIGINFDADDGKPDAYGGLFKDFKKKHNK